MFTPQFKKLLALIVIFAGVGLLAFALVGMRNDQLSLRQEVSTLKTHLVIVTPAPSVSPTATPAAMFNKTRVTVAPTKAFVTVAPTK